MQPAVIPLEVVAGDNFELAIRLYTTDGGDRSPLEVSTGEAFVIAVDWGRGRLVSTTSDPFDVDGLTLLTSGGRTELVRKFTPAETRRFLGFTPIWSLYRIPGPGQRRTYVTGLIKVLGPGMGGQGDTSLDVTVLDESITVDLSVPDAASYTDAREAIIRADMAAAIADAENFSAATSLLLG